MAIIVFYFWHQGSGLRGDYISRCCFLGGKERMIHRIHRSHGQGGMEASSGKILRDWDYWGHREQNFMFLNYSINNMKLSFTFLLIEYSKPSIKL